MCSGLRLHLNCNCPDLYTKVERKKKHLKLLFKSLVNPTSIATKYDDAIVEQQSKADGEIYSDTTRQTGRIQ